MSKEITIHPSITEDLVMRSIERRNMTLDNPGICLTCGNEQDGCEPDARKYECEACGERTVYGDEEILMMGYFHSGGRS